MKKILQKIMLHSSVLAALMLPVGLLAAPAFAAPDIDGSLCQGANLEFGSDASCDEGDPESTVNNIITNVINIFSVIVGVVAVVMIIIGGLKYITAGGDSGNVSGAKNTILFALIGLVIVALAQVVVRFVLSRTIQATE